MSRAWRVWTILLVFSLTLSVWITLEVLVALTRAGWAGIRRASQ